MDNQVVVILSTPEGDIGKLVVRELNDNGNLSLDQLFKMQKDMNRGIFNILREDDKVIGIYRDKGYMIYPLNDGIIKPHSE